MAHVYAARAVLPSMLERGAGYLLKTASAAGLLTQIGSAPYAVTKHAAVALAEWLAITYGDRGRQGVRAVPASGAHRDDRGHPDGGGAARVDGMIEPDDVAEGVVEGLARSGS